MATTLTNLLFHVVFSTKERRSLIKPPLQEDLYRYIGGIIRKRRGILLEIGGVADHVHLLAKLPADLCVSDMLRLIKTNSSRWVSERPDRRMRFAWQAGYGAFSVSQSNVPAVQEYIRNQEQHHRQLSFQEEFLQLLRQHQIDVDERYLWD